MKKVTVLIIAAAMILHTRISAQTTEGYLSNNLGRIVEVANSGGTLTTPHLLIGYDTTGIVYQSNSLNAFRIFANSPSTTTLQSLNSQNRFGAPGTNDCYEIRFGSDSSRYWINTSILGTGGNLAPNQLPFSVYYVGPKPSADTSVTGGIKLCVKVTDQDTNGIFTAGERITVFADLQVPLDSTYDSLSHRAANPFVTNRSVITYLRFGAASVPYSQTTFSVPGDGFIPPSGTVIRFVAKTGDAIAPIVYNLTDTFRTSGIGIFTSSFNVYSYEVPVYTLTDAPAGMTVSDGVITWNVTESQIGQVYNVILQASNGAGVSTRMFRAKGSWGTQEIKTEGAGNLIRMWQRNDGSIAYRASQSIYGMEYPINSGYTLNYAGGFYFGGIKSGSGNPDTVNVAQCEYQSEFQPGRILNSGPFGTLQGQDYMQHNTLFTLPGNELTWPPDAPRNTLNEPLRLSLIDTWTAFNDLSISNVSDPFSLSPGFGLEIQRQTFQFSLYPFNNAVLVRMRCINKSDMNYDSCYFGLWNDPDVGGNAGDDLATVDSSLALITVYSDPAGSDPHPSAFGCAFLQLPLNTGTAGDTAVVIGITEQGFSRITKPGYKSSGPSAAIAYQGGIGDPDGRGMGDRSRYWYESGYDLFGYPKPLGPFDLTTVGNEPGDKRMVFGAGPFSFTAGDTQDVWYAMIGGMGVTKAAAVDTIHHYAEMMRRIFMENMNDYLVSIHDPVNPLPQGVSLHPNYPNPFNPSTTIRYELKQASKVTLKIYNLLGQEVRTLVNAQKSSGIHSVIWDGKNHHGQRVTSGVYFYRLEAGDFVKTRKMVLVK